MCFPNLLPHSPYARKEITGISPIPPFSTESSFFLNTGTFPQLHHPDLSKKAIFRVNLACDPAL